MFVFQLQQRFIGRLSDLQNQNPSRSNSSHETRDAVCLASDASTNASLELELLAKRVNHRGKGNAALRKRIVCLCWGSEDRIPAVYPHYTLKTMYPRDVTLFLSQVRLRKESEKIDGGRPEVLDPQAQGSRVGLVSGCSGCGCTTRAFGHPGVAAERDFGVRFPHLDPFRTQTRDDSIESTEVNETDSSIVPSRSND